MPCALLHSQQSSLSEAGICASASSCLVCVNFCFFETGAGKSGPNKLKDRSPECFTLARSIARWPLCKRELADSGGSGGAIGCFRQLVIPSAVKGFMISLRSHDFSETRLLTGFIVPKPNIWVETHLLHHCQEQARCLFHNNCIFLWGVGVGQESPPIEGLLIMVQHLSRNRVSQGKS